MPPNAPLIARIEEQLAEAGLQVTVEFSDGALILNGIVESEEAREAASDIASSVVPDARIDNQVEVQTVVETIEPDFGSDRPVVTDPIEIVGPQNGPEDIAESGETYTPPDDPVLTTNRHGEPRVLGGFDSSSDDDDVDVSSDGTTGDEALAEAVRRELAQDSATTDLTIIVAVRNGVAHLRGEVADLDDADNAESVAARVPGIREVVEELDVANV